MHDSLFCVDADVSESGRLGFVDGLPSRATPKQR